MSHLVLCKVSVSERQESLYHLFSPFVLILIKLITLRHFILNHFELFVSLYCT